MLEEINRLKPFFEDCYREISVREYSREMKISPPTASKLLKQLSKEGLLNMRKDRGFLLFRTNRESKVMKQISLTYWANKLNDLTQTIDEKLRPNAIILFGSLSKLETTPNSDIDIAILGEIKKELSTDKLEKKIGRKIQLFIFENLEKVNKSLKLAVINGHTIGGYIS